MNNKNIFSATVLISALLLTSACSRVSISVMAVIKSPDKGQYVIYESGKPVLQYNYRTVYENDAVRPESHKDRKIEYYPIGGVYIHSLHRYL